MSRSVQTPRRVYPAHPHRFETPRTEIPMFRATPALSLPSARTLALALLTTAAAACSPETAAQLPSAEDERAAPVDVTVVRVTRGSVGYEAEIGSHLLPRRAVDLSADVTARVQRVYVEEGDRVRAGQLLVRLDAAHARAIVAQSDAMASSAQVQAAQLAREYDRLAPLAERGAVAVSETDQLAASRDAALATAQASREARSAATTTLRTYVIRAPFDGIVESLPAEVGQVASQGGATLVRLIDLSEVEARVKVSESLLPGIAVGGAATAHLRSLDLRVTGRVERVGYELDPLTHTASVLVRFPNPDTTLRAGMFAYVTLTEAAPPEGLLLPAAAVRSAAGQSYVYRVTDDTARRVNVTARPVDANTMAVLSGLEEGDQVVVRAEQPLREDVRVRAQVAQAGSPGAQDATPEVAPAPSAANAAQLAGEAAQAEAPAEPEAAE
ncbi:MAG: efflux RND transporter periplasmic adaptor subunit [Sandaracinaceae bacterium]|nr:efflux RND transporter periplasmic adaptor subunit [Sandaracinaceae bacterium]